MTDQELEQRLREALARTAPDDAAAVLARCGAKQGKVIPMREARPSAPKKRRPWRGLVAACLALALLGGGGGIFYQRAYAVASVVSLDVNPSIEMRVNRQEKVLSCTALNQDAAAVLADMGGGRDLEGAKLDVAVNAVVGALVRGGYRISWIRPSSSPWRTAIRPGPPGSSRSWSPPWADFYSPPPARPR